MPHSQTGMSAGEHAASWVEHSTGYRAREAGCRGSLALACAATQQAAARQLSSDAASTHQAGTPKLEPRQS